MAVQGNEASARPRGKWLGVVLCAVAAAIGWGAGGFIIIIAVAQFVDGLTATPAEDNAARHLFFIVLGVPLVIVGSFFIRKAIKIGRSDKA